MAMTQQEYAQILAGMRREIAEAMQALQMQQRQDLQNLNAGVGVANKNARDAAGLAKAAHDRAEAMVQQQLAQQNEALQGLAAAIERMQVSRTGGDPNIQRVENIPGKRIPFDVVVQIPVPANATGVLQESAIISQEGPFVATRRWMTVLSQLQVQDSQSGVTFPTFFGRSFGRYRPPHSAWDLNDGQPYPMPLTTLPDQGEPFYPAIPSMSPFRSMESDFRVEFLVQGSSFPRQDKPVPSTIWTEQINSPYELSCLDFFERNEVLTFKIQPQHPSNPAYGNVALFTGAGTTYPQIDGQYDAVEGIYQVNGIDEDEPTITRVPDMLVIMGFSGYRIIQPPGAGPY